MRGRPAMDMEASHDGLQSTATADLTPDVGASRQTTGEVHVALRDLGPEENLGESEVWDLAEPTVIVQKPPVPTIWLDTCVISEMANIEHVLGPSDSRYRRLLERVSEAVAGGRLVCVEGGQDDELKVGGRFVAERRETLTRLTRGVRLQHRFLIERFQFAAAARCFLKGGERIEIPWKAAFEEPSRLLKAKPETDPIVTVQWSVDSEDAKRTLEARRRLKGWLEDLRLGNNTAELSFDDAEEPEFEETLEAIDQGLELLDPPLIWTPSTRMWSPLRAIGVEFARDWRACGGTRDQFTAFRSSLFPQLVPSWSISARLFADLVTRDRRIKGTGDSQDFWHASTALPYVHFFVTDDEHRRRLLALDVATQYDTYVASIQTVDALLEALP